MNEENGKPCHVLDEIIAQCIVREDDGEPVDRQDLLQQHPELAEELRSFFSDRDRFKRLARPLSSSRNGSGELPEKLRYFGDYELLEEVAQGGMGVIYRARQASLNRIVAVKMILASHLASDVDVKRFKEEAETAANLRHKGIVAIHEVGQYNGQNYFSMDLVDGHDLATLIRTDTFSPLRAAEVVQQAAEAVEYAHQQGTIHRDLKPSNILVDKSGHVRITDFGLAMRVDGEGDLTRTGQILGTPAYMSPEQAAARRDQIGPASDIYSLGAILYELLTERPPFRGESVVDVMRQVVEAEPLPPSRLNRRIPRDLETICLKCLEKDPGQRYKTAALLADDLGHFLAGEPILARPIHRIERAWRWSRRNPLIATLSAATVTLLAVVAVVASVFYLREYDLRTQLENAVVQIERSLDTLEQEQLKNEQLQQGISTLEKKREVLDQSLINGQHELYQVLIELARAEWHAGDIVRADLYLEKCPATLRKRDWEDLKRLCRPPMKTFKGRGCLAVSPDRTLLASVDNNNVLTVWQADTGDIVQTMSGQGAAVTKVAFNHDGTILASAGGRHLYLWSLKTGELLRTLSDASWPLSDVAFSSDGLRLAAATDAERRSSGMGEVIIWDSVTGEIQHRLPGYGHIALSADGRWLACRHDQLQDRTRKPLIQVWDLTAPFMEPRYAFPTVSGSAAPMTFGPEGRRLAVTGRPRSSSSGEHSIEIWNLDHGQLVQRLPTGIRVQSMAWGPQGKRIAVGGKRELSETQRDSFMVAVFNLITGEKDRQLPWYNEPASDLGFAAGGRLLATATSSGLKVWDVSPADDPTEAILAFKRQRDVGPLDWPEWGGSPFRINTPYGKNIPSEWDIGRVERKTAEWFPADSKNILWSTRLGSQTYGNPVVANGRIFLGTNNGAGYLKRYPATVDLGVLLCLEEKTGRFLWQHSNEKLATGRLHDWPLQGVCSTPVVDGDRLWYVSNRGQVVCLDTEAFSDDEDDGFVQQEWMHLFSGVRTTVADDLNPARGRAIPSDMYAALGDAGEHRRFGLKKQGTLPSRWQLGTWRYQVFTPHYVAVLEDGQIRVYPATEEGEIDGPSEICSLPNQRFPNLEAGEIDPALRSLFAGRGVDLPPQTVVQVVERNKLWRLEAVIGGERREIRIEKGASHVGLNAEMRMSVSDNREADVVWKYDMMRELGISQHNMANCSMVTVDGKLFVCTSNGLDESHINIPAPEAPSFIALDRTTGELLWTDNSPGKNILHAQWASPSYGVFDGHPQVIFAGGDGWVYSFDPRGDGHGKSKLLWKFDANPKHSKWILGGRGTRNNIIAFPAIYDGLVYISVGQDPEHGEGTGHLWCIDPTKCLDGGDVSDELAIDLDGNIVPHRRIQAVDPSRGERAILNPRSAVRWHYAFQDRNGDGEIDFEETFHRSISIPVIKDDLLYVADFAGLFHCLNAKTGKVYWTYDCLAACWGSALLVDGKVYLADEDGEVAVFRHSADPNVAMIKGEPIHEILMDSSIYMTPIVANNVLYIASKNRLWAIANTPAESSSGPSAEKGPENGTAIPGQPLPSKPEGRGVKQQDADASDDS